MNTELIDTLYAIVEEACKEDSNVFGYGIWSHHIYPMVSIAQALAQQSSADEEIVMIAVLLHDLAGIQNADDAAEHHIVGAVRAKEILQLYHYPAERITAVQQCIKNHRGSVNIRKSTIEEICVADADAIVHMTEIASLFYVAYKERGMAIDDGKQWLREKIERDWKKMSENSKTLFKHRYYAVLKALQQDCFHPEMALFTISSRFAGDNEYE